MSLLASFQSRTYKMAKETGSLTAAEQFNLAQENLSKSKIKRDQKGSRKSPDGRRLGGSYLRDPTIANDN